MIETLQTLLNYQPQLAQSDWRLVVSAPIWESVAHPRFDPLVKNISFSLDDHLQESFDFSINLSLNEQSWDYHGEIKSSRKKGPVRINGEVKISDPWSTHLMTLRGPSAFLTFHLQDIYKNILGLEMRAPLPRASAPFKTIVFALSNPHHFPAEEQEAFMNVLPLRLKGTEVKDISEVNEHSSSSILYIGPPTVEAIKLNASRNIFLTSQFQGFNLVTRSPETHLISAKGKSFHAQDLMGVIENIIRCESLSNSPYDVYQLQNEESLSYWECSGQGEDYFPFYQAYVVLWSFLLNLKDLDLGLRPSGPEQKILLENQLEVLNKLIRLHDYATVSLDTIFKAAKSSEPEADSIQGHLKNLREIDATFGQISESQPLLRPLLDFYHIRRGQNEGRTLLEQTQDSILAYQEEHQALQAFEELLTKLKGATAPTG